MKTALHLSESAPGPPGLCPGRSGWCPPWATCTRAISRWCRRPGPSAPAWSPASSSTRPSSAPTKIWPPTRATCARDLDLLESAGVDLVWTPTPEMMYPPGFQTWVTVEEVTQPLEGSMRPGHFRGVTTVVAKLFNAVQPDKAYFGQKDAQQAAVIRQMARDLEFPWRSWSARSCASRMAWPCPAATRI